MFHRNKLISTAAPLFLMASTTLIYSLHLTDSNCISLYMTSLRYKLLPSDYEVAQSLYVRLEMRCNLIFKIM
jgi:hypothetical protein